LVKLECILSILSSAANCDYLVTYDQKLKKASSYLYSSKPIVVTPEELLEVIDQKYSPF
jgi:predicted nucleic acid-binding protein